MKTEERVKSHLNGLYREAVTERVTFIRLDVQYLFDYLPWALIKFWANEDGCVFDVGAYSRVGAYFFPKQGHL